MPYGYRLETFMDGARERSRLVPGPDEEVDTVRRMFDLSANHGIGVKRIANRLNEEGVPAPRGRYWNAGTIGFMLKNPVYVGDAVWCESRKQGRSGRRKADQDERIVVEDAHPALISRELFDERQEQADRRRIDFRMKKKSTSRPVKWLLTGLIQCDHCGGTFVGRKYSYKVTSGEKRTRHVYYCGGYLNKGTAVCAPLPVPKEYIEEKVLKAIRFRFAMQQGWDELQANVKGRLLARKAKYGDPEAVRRKITELEDRIANYYRAIGEGLDPLICQQHIAELTAKKEEVEREAERLEEEGYYDRGIEQHLEVLERFAKAFSEDFENLPFTVRRAVALHFTERVEIVDREKVRIHLHLPFGWEGTQLLIDVLNGKAVLNEESPALGAGLSTDDSLYQSRRKWLPLLDGLRILDVDPEARVIEAWTRGIEMLGPEGLADAHAHRGRRRGAPVVQTLLSGIRSRPLYGTPLTPPPTLRPIEQVLARLHRSWNHARR